MYGYDLCNAGSLQQCYFLNIGRAKIICAESSAVLPTALDMSGQIFVQKEQLFLQLCTQPQTLVINPCPQDSLPPPPFLRFNCIELLSFLGVT